MKYRLHFYHSMTIQTLAWPCGRVQNGLIFKKDEPKPDRSGDYAVYDLLHCTNKSKNNIYTYHYLQSESQLCPNLMHDLLAKGYLDNYLKLSQQNLQPILEM